MPPHLHYVEPYFGGGAVLLARDPERDWLIDDEWRLKNGDKVPTELRGCSEVVNDIDGELMNFWDCLQGRENFEEFVRLVSSIPFSEPVWKHAVAVTKAHAADPSRSTLMPVPTRAALFFIRYRQSRQGLGEDFATLSRNRTRRRMNEQASAWLSCIEGLPAMHERLKRVVILNHDALEVIEQQDGPRTLFYLDPPYLHDTRTAKKAYGPYEMRDDEHLKLLLELEMVHGKFLLSGYRNPMYDEHAEAFGWHRVDFNVPNNAAGGKAKRRMVESVWANYELKVKA